MMKNIKTIVILAIIAFTLTGCTNKPIEDNSSSIIESTINSTTSEKNDSDSSTTTESNLDENSSINNSSKSNESESTSTFSENNKHSDTTKPVEKPVEKPTISSTTPIASKPVESKPTSTTTTTKPVEKPVIKPAYNCVIEGHVWNELTPETSTETIEIKETHEVSTNGYDYDLAYRYFGRKKEDINFVSILGNKVAYSSSPTQVKTTGTTVTTEYIHKCIKCDLKEVYNTEKTVTPNNAWTFVNKPHSPNFSIIWYDIDNIPDEVYKGIEKDNKAAEEFWDSF